MKKFVLDTSGLSKPIQDMPPHRHKRLWNCIKQSIGNGVFATTEEVFEEEMLLLPDGIGAYMADNRSSIVLDFGDPYVNWNDYVITANEMQILYRESTQRTLQGRTDTVGIKDISVVALAKVLNLPLVSEAALIHDTSQTYKRKIPNVCAEYSVKHLSFNEFIDAEDYDL